MVRRIYVEKKQGFDVEAAGLFRSMKDDLHLQSVTGLRILNRYDIDGIDDETYEAAKFTVFAEPAIDSLYEEELPGDISSANFFGVEFLPGQYDQRADSADYLFTWFERRAAAGSGYLCSVRRYHSG